MFSAVVRFAAREVLCGGVDAVGVDVRARSMELGLYVALGCALIVVGLFDGLRLGLTLGVGLVLPVGEAVGLALFGGEVRCVTDVVGPGVGIAEDGPGVDGGFAEGIDVGPDEGAADDGLVVGLGFGFAEVGATELGSWVGADLGFAEGRVDGLAVALEVGPFEVDLAELGARVGSSSPTVGLDDGALDGRLVVGPGVVAAEVGAAELGTSVGDDVGFTEGALDDGLVLGLNVGLVEVGAAVGGRVGL